MSFSDRIIRTPFAFDVERGNEISALYSGSDPRLRELVKGAAGCSPFLAGLLHRERDWFEGNIEDPEKAIKEVLGEVSSLAPDALSNGLRQAKRKVALLTAVADLGGVWPLEQVTQALTDFADASVDVILKSLVGQEIRRGKIPGLSEKDAGNAGGMTALAMGKMGAGELNYSSDIDLIVLFDETRFDEHTYHDARAAFIRITRKMAGLLSDQTAEGYVFRTDLRLRPDASVTPVCLSMAAAESYYESVGRTWERAAYIKARACAGDVDAGTRFLDTLRPFVWRKHLDFAAIQDAHDMRLRIRDHKGLHGPLKLSGHNVKLGRGGIREIEFFTQTRQLIAGGRDPSLRVRDTKSGLEALAAAGWVETDTSDVLYTHYVAHRELEHRLQMIGDQQTQTLPTNDEGFARLAAFCGVELRDLTRDLEARFEEVHELTEGFFAPGQAGSTAESESDFGASVTARWPSYPALRSARAVEIFKRLRPEILARLQEAAKPDEALQQFDAFLSGLPAGVQLFSLFEANPQLTRLVVDICSTAPALAQYLSRNASVFDGVIGGAFFTAWPDLAELSVSLTEALGEAEDYELKLNAARRWLKEWHFRVGVHHLRGLIEAEEAGRQYADLAEAVVAGLWPVVVEEFSRKHGSPPGNGAAVVGMGSLGVRRLNATSDLDLIMIYDPANAESSEGKRPLAVRPYYARLTQALVTALTAPMADGRLYEVDMRLRPSGRQGPVATALGSFESYQLNEAWTWEHLALTRARSVAGSEAVMAAVERIRCEVIAQKANGASILDDVSEMRQRIADAKPAQGAWDAKVGAGRLQDIELIAQTAALRAGSRARRSAEQIAAGVASGWFDAADAEALQAALGLFWRLQVSARLLTGGRLDPEDLGEGGRRFILRETGHETIAALEQAIQDVSAAAEKVVDRLLQGRS
jgi:glutamate-ammonia-ligase adenylyltransferase